jgi:hypothetical protein
MCSIVALAWWLGECSSVLTKAGCVLAAAHSAGLIAFDQYGSSA